MPNVTDHIALVCQITSDVLKLQIDLFQEKNPVREIYNRTDETPDGDASILLAI